MRTVFLFVLAILLSSLLLFVLSDDGRHPHVPPFSINARDDRTLCISPIIMHGVAFVTLNVGRGSANCILDTGSSDLLVHSQHCSTCKRRRKGSGYIPSNQAQLVTPHVTLSKHFVTQNDDVSVVQDIVRLTQQDSHLLFFNVVKRTRGQSNYNILGLGPNASFLREYGIHSFVFQRNSICFHTKQLPPVKSAVDIPYDLTVPHHYVVHTSSPSGGGRRRRIMVDSGSNRFVWNKAVPRSPHQRLDLRVDGLRLTIENETVTVAYKQRVASYPLLTLSFEHADLIVPVYFLLRKGLLDKVIFDVDRKFISLHAFE
jgi:hypothetical protein